MNNCTLARWGWTCAIAATLAVSPGPADAAPPTQPTTETPATAAVEATPTPGPTATAGDAFAELARRHRCQRFLDLLERSGMAGVTRGQNPVTVFLPTDAAFDRLPAPVVAALATGDVRVARRLLSGHLGWGHAAYTKIGPSAAVRTVAGNAVFMQKHGSDWSVAGAKVIFGDQPAGVALVHVIDTVLLPPRWADVDEKELLTDSSIAMSGRGGGLLHAEGCASGAPSVPATARGGGTAVAASGGGSTGGAGATPVKPARPAGPRGGFEPATVGEPEPPSEPETAGKSPTGSGTDGPTGPSPAGPAPTTPGDAGPPAPTGPACGCGLLPA